MNDEVEEKPKKKLKAKAKAKELQYVVAEKACVLCRGKMYRAGMEIKPDFFTNGMTDFERLVASKTVVEKV